MSENGVRTPNILFPNRKIWGTSGEQNGEQTRGTTWGTDTKMASGRKKKNVPHVVSLGNTIDFGEQDYHLASPVNLKLKGICLSMGLLICVDLCGFPRVKTI